MTIVDCLGRERAPDKIFPDGSWNCPFCWAAVVAGSDPHEQKKCPNPACYARGGNGYPEFPADVARAQIAEAEKRKKEQDDWIARQRWAREYNEKRRAEEDARLRDVMNEAERRGACQSCAVESARYGRPPKYTRHRKACPQ